MSYLVLARKYRPQNFQEVIGQEHISELLEKAIKSDRIAHAYLFCGPRGIGKTSSARILSKSLNCIKGPTIQPCGECMPCQEIAKGTSFDVIEIDGASNRGIDEIRTLRENVKFAPSYGRYKIYIIDEVHMLTNEAFNALLKTLEEPPPHAKFILATTAPSKLPATIISRCQRFDFKRISLKTTAEALQKICQKENFNIEADALFAIAKASQGSMRDALSILDQLSSLSDRNIRSADVFSMLGLVETQYLFDLVDAVAQKNSQSALEVLEKIIDQGKDIKQLVQDLTEHFRNLMIIKIGGKSLGKLVDYPAQVKDQILVQCQQMDLKTILMAIDILIETQEVMRVTETLQMPLEIALAKLTYQEGKSYPQAPSTSTPVKATNPVQQHKSTSPVVQKIDSNVEPKLTPKSSPMDILKNEKGHIENTGSAPQLEVLEAEDDIPSPEAYDEANFKFPEQPSVIDLEHIRQTWDSLTHSVTKIKMSVATFLQEGIPVELNNNKLIIGFPDRCKFQKESLETQANVKIVEKALAEKYNKDLVVQYRIVADIKPNVEDPDVKKALEAFKGKVVNRWHNE